MARWPRLARVEAAALFAFATLTAGQLPAPRGLAVEVTSRLQDAPVGWIRTVSEWLVLGVLTAIPYSAVLVAVSGLLLLRKGYLLLSLLAATSWAALAFLLWPLVAPRAPVDLSGGAAAGLAAAIALLLHRRPLIIGARDRGFVRMRLLAGHDETTTWRRPKRASRGLLADGQPWVAPNPRGRASRTARSAAVARSTLPWGLVFAVAYNAYVYRHQIRSQVYRLDSGLASEQHTSVGPDEAIATRGGDGRFVFDVVADGAGLQVVYDPQASFLTLSAETADRLGLSRRDESFSTLTRMSSGFVHVTPATIDTMTVGNITVSHLSAYVARSGELSSNILGQSFLARLSSYVVLRDRLVLKGR